MHEEITMGFLGVITGMKTSGPRPLRSRFRLEMEERGIDLSVQNLMEHLSSAGPNEPIRQAFSLQLALWDDAAEIEPWTEGHAKRTIERRLEIYRALGLETSFHAQLNSYFPIRLERNLVIAEEFEPWYTPKLQAQRQFYWSAYENHLLRKKQWSAESVADLSSTTIEIVQRLSEPVRAEAYQSKGLVVGYVQSGKTANIAGVLARAIDAGYRLLIVMTGTIDLLREQTQRRLDMELVGRENILRNIDTTDLETMASVDYQDDPDWPDFVSHDALPSDLGQPDVVRLTNHRFAGRSGDYKRLLTGITALEFEKRDNSLPLNDPVNLYRSSARLAIVKKNAPVLKKLVADLKSIRPKLKEIPALIIDDESDLASVNTSNPRKWEEHRKERTAINGLISELLGLLPRAQYIGYTATPFANVFVDPDDVQDIFPKDFLVALTRPLGYMGASDFHDLDVQTDEDDRPIVGSQERAHVRDLIAEVDDEAGRRGELLHALGMFVLTGAIKLWRAEGDDTRFRHHTMLVHESVKQIEHLQLANEIEAVWRRAGFSSPQGMSILEDLYSLDVAPTSADLGEGHMLPPFELLKPFIGESVRRITETGRPVIIVNSAKDVATENIDFDKRAVWRVLVGGAKLSRGFTVEGLTISYYRRKTQQADTLMQMGRWFGFRTGYRDLVRLYIDRQVRVHRREFDLYEAFGAVIRAEELFREELGRYAGSIDGKPQITPAQVAPLVTQHLPWLRPTAPNKMFNALLEVRRLPEIEPVAYPEQAGDKLHNYETMLRLVRSAQKEQSFVFPKTDGVGTFRAKLGIVDHHTLVATLEDHRWGYSDHFDADLAFLKEPNNSIEEWLVLVPFLQTGAKHHVDNVGQLSVSYRARNRGPLFQAISDPKHREAARKIAGISNKAAYVDEFAEGLTANGRGVIIIYPITEVRFERIGSDTHLSRNDCIFAMRIVPPSSALRSESAYVSFRVRDNSRAEEPIVAVDRV